MQNIDIIKTSHQSESFKVSQIRGMYDIQNTQNTFELKATLDVPQEWNVGCIVGPSGTGKSSIIDKYYKKDIVQTHYTAKSVIDDFDTDAKTTAQLFTSVGFSSPPDWLKPYGVLSNGQKMRVDLAYALSLNKDLIVFDEFTSVVDRQVAKIGSHAISKYIKRNNKKFIAVSCHYDILDWLEPDWAFDTKTNKMLKKNSPDQKLQYKFINTKDYGVCLKTITI